MGDVRFMVDQSFSIRYETMIYLTLMVIKICSRTLLHSWDANENEGITYVYQ